MGFVQATKEQLNKWIERIEKHSNCKEYHNILGNKATCLDIIIQEIEEELGEVEGRLKETKGLK